jgi:hypothetical protein
MSWKLQNNIQCSHSCATAKVSAYIEYGLLNKMLFRTVFSILFLRPVTWNSDIDPT